MPPKTGLPQPNNDQVVEDLRALFAVLAVINETLDAAALSLGADATREMALILLILRKNSKGVSEKRLVELYATWNVEVTSQELRDTVHETLVEMLNGELVRARVIGRGEDPLDCIELSELGEKRTKSIRKIIDARIDEAKKYLKRNSRKQFEQLLKTGLPLPRTRN